MKKFCLICFTLVLFLCGSVAVKADGLDPVPTPTPTPTATPTASPNTYSNEVKKQEVKAPNEKKSKVLPITITVVGLGAVGGGWYLIKMRR